MITLAENLQSILAAMRHFFYVGYYYVIAKLSGCKFALSNNFASSPNTGLCL